MTLESAATTLQHWRGAVSVVWMVVLLTWESWAPFFRFFPTIRQRAAHGLRNLAISWANALMTALGFVLLWRLAAEWSAEHRFGLLHRTSIPGWLHLPLSCLLLDAWTYAWHRFCHRIPFLWRFHRMHHSDPHMDVTTANRFHLVEILFSSVLRLPLLALTGIPFGHLVLYETLLQCVVQWHHANIALPAGLERFLRAFLVTPGLHKVHHSRFQPETDSNYASLLSVWDRLFGSFRTRTDLAAIHIGLDGYDDAPTQSLRGLCLTPWRR